MKKILFFVLPVLLVSFGTALPTAASSDSLNVKVNKDNRTISISGTFDKKYVSQPAGLTVTDDESTLPDFGTIGIQGETNVYISLQDTCIDSNGKFEFKNIVAGDMSKNLKLNVTATLDNFSDEQIQYKYMPSIQAVNNFLEYLEAAQSGDDILRLINADIEKKYLDGKDIRIGLDDYFYKDFSDKHKTNLANKIYAKHENDKILKVSQFEEAFIEQSVIEAFLSANTPDKALSFINPDNTSVYYDLIYHTLNIPDIQKLSTIKTFCDYEAAAQSLVLGKINDVSDVQGWIDSVNIAIINYELSLTTKGKLKDLLNGFADILNSVDFEKYNKSDYISMVNAKILDKKSFSAVNELCEFINDTVKYYDELNSSGSGSSAPIRGSHGKETTGSGFSVSLDKGTTDSGFAITPETKPEESFTDLDSVEWARAAVTELYKRNIINGKETGKFHPNDNITKEEFVKIIVLAFSAYNANASCEFDDVSKDEWQYPYIASALESGIVYGISDSEFGAGISVSREDAATIIYRAMQRAKADKGYEATNTFLDSDEISEYARFAVGALHELEIVNGMEENVFRPKELCTRAQAAKMIYETLLMEEN